MSLEGLISYESGKVERWVGRLILVDGDRRLLTSMNHQGIYLPVAYVVLVEDQRGHPIVAWFVVTVS